VGWGNGMERKRCEREGKYWVMKRDRGG
jgi:hypothetical protein